MWHKGVIWHHVESDVLKEGPVAKTSWEVRDAEHQIHTIKVLFKSNTKSHEHPSIRLFIIRFYSSVYSYAAKLLIEPLGAKFKEILIEIHIFSFK